jgi:hypothetical protein
MSWRERVLLALLNWRGCLTGHKVYRFGDGYLAADRAGEIVVGGQSPATLGEVEAYMRAVEARLKPRRQSHG